MAAHVRVWLAGLRVSINDREARDSLTTRDQWPATDQPPLAGVIHNSTTSSQQQAPSNAYDLRASVGPVRRQRVQLTFTFQTNEPKKPQLGLGPPPPQTGAGNQSINQSINRPIRLLRHDKMQANRFHWLLRKVSFG